MNNSPHVYTDTGYKEIKDFMEGKTIQSFKYIHMDDNMEFKFTDGTSMEIDTAGGIDFELKGVK